VPGQQIAAFAVIHQNAGLVCHLGVAALDEDIRDLVLVQHFVQVDVAAEDLAFARLDDEAVDGLVEEFF